MKSLFDEATHKELLNRLNNIAPETNPIWGKMNAGQMMRHCQMPLELALGKTTIPKPNFFMKLLMTSFKKGMYNEKLWKKNMPTPKQFRVEDERNFDQEKSSLTELIDGFYKTRNQKERDPHPAFGYFTYNQWGQMQYKHLDHHFRQFGV
jgi:hypothetical protein